MQRRNFLLNALAATAAGALAPRKAVAQTPNKPAPTNIRLGFDTFSIRAFGWKDIQLLDYAAAQKVDAIQMSSLDDFASLDPAHLKKVRQHAEQVGVAIDAGLGCMCPASKAWKDDHGSPAEYLATGLRVAEAVGSPSLRCYMGTRDDRRSYDNLEKCMASAVEVFRSVRSLAMDKNIKFAIENHAGDMQAREVLGIIRAAGPEFVGSCLDTGNPVWAGECPFITLEVLGQHVLTTHVRDSVVFEHPRGAVVQWVALGDGVVDFQRFVERFRQLCPKSAMHLEIITGVRPEVVPYLEAEYWRVYPKTLAQDFAQFVELARHGHPFMGSMVVEENWGKNPPEYGAALREQQKIDLERSFDYASKMLGVGVRRQLG